MKHSVGKILAIAFLLVLALSCARTGRVIPEEKFSDIYAEMLLADQWISSNLKARRVADTTLFYAPILEKYGYDEREALPAFLNSQTYAMLANPEMGMCQFGPPAIFDMWECEKVTGNPRLSAYLRMV